MTKGSIYKLATLAFIIGILLIGAFLADDYGQSWDDPNNATYGLMSLRGYLGIDAFNENPYWRSHGPAYFMVSAAITRLFGLARDSAEAISLRHFLNYSSFVLACASVYFIARHLFDDAVSTGIALLFASQPVFFGHGFINQKDTPFMAMFAASMALGLVAADRWLDYVKSKEGSRVGSEFKFLRELRKSWQGRHLWQKSTSIGLMILFLLLLIAIWHPDGLTSIVFEAKSTAIAEGEIGLILAWTRPVLTLLTLSLFIGLSVLLLKVQVGRVLKGHFAWLLPIIATGILIGLTTSIRIAGPLAGFLVGLYLFLKAPQIRSVILIFFMAAVAILVAYLTWPSLWQAPLDRVSEVLNLTTNYEDRPVIYWGQFLWSDELPWHFLPTMIGIQLTLPALILAILGLGYTFIASVKKRSWTLLILLLWFLLPTLIVVIFRTPIYDNFRQLLFSFPPLFILAGLPISFLIERMPEFGFVILMVVILLPGLVALVQLHPYQYIYYNQLVGGVSGVEGRFELDYWCTSYRQAIEYVDKVSDGQVKVVAYKIGEVAEPYAGERVRIIGSNQPLDQLDYAIGCELALTDPEFFPSMNTIHEVQVRGATIAVVKAPE